MPRESRIEGYRRDLRLLEQLGEDPAYLLLNSLIQGQLDALSKVLFAPVKTLDSTLEQEYSKGSFEGRCAWENVRTTHIEVLESEITLELERLEYVNNDTTEKPTNADGSPFDRDVEQPAGAP